VKRREFLRGVGGAAAGTLIAARRAWSSVLEDLARGRSELGDDDPRFWELVRSQFHLAPGTAYLNTGGLGASPFAVTNVVKAMMDREEEAPAPGHSEEDWARIRGKCAALLGPGCTADEVALVSTATEGINIVLNGLALGRGDEVITSTHEHVALAIPLLYRMRTAGIVVRTFEPDASRAQGNVERVEALMTPRTRIVFISHVTCTTGQVFPVADIARLAAARNVLFALDGAQSLAQFPIDIRATGADFYTASAHKWLLGPKRTGILYVRRDRLERLAPTIVGAYSDRSNSLADRQLELRPNAQRFEYGTQNDALVYGLGAAADFVATIGLETIWAHNRSLAEAFVEGLQKIEGVDLLSPSDRVHRSAMPTFRVRGRDNRQVASALMSARLRVRSVTEAGLDAVRVSFHVYNNTAEVEKLLGAVGKIAGGAPSL
jgi:selenocysteine lyase/cysteine desulfurase